MLPAEVNRRVRGKTSNTAGQPQQQQHPAPTADVPDSAEAEGEAPPSPIAAVPEAGGVQFLSEDDIQEWLDEKNPAELVNALYQMLEPPAWADELCNPAAPTTTPPPHMFTECMQRPHIHAWPKTAFGAAEVGALFVGTPPPRADALPPTLAAAK